MWLDALFFLTITVITALAAQRNVSGLVVSIGTLLVYHPLLLLSTRNLGASLLAGVVVAVGLGFAGRFLARALKLKNLPGSLLGALGGVLLGLVVVLSFSVSLPIQRDINGIVYPPTNVSRPLAQALVQSRVMQLGRTVLLYPLFNPDQFGSSERPMLEGMHNFFVVGEPWQQTQ